MSAKEYLATFATLALFLVVMLGIDIIAPVISPVFGPLVVLAFVAGLIFLMIRLAKK